MKYIRILCNVDMDDLDEDINLKIIKKNLTEGSLRKGSKSIQYLYSWPYEDYSIICYGYIDGPAGSENKHDLPPSGIKHNNELDESDTQLLFGDLFILKKNTKLCDFDVADYGLFHSMCFGGFDDCLSDDYSSESCLSDDEENEDKICIDDFIVNDESNNEINDDEESYTISDEDLEEDMNEY